MNNCPDCDKLKKALKEVLRYCVTVNGFPDAGKGRTKDQQTAFDNAVKLLSPKNQAIQEPKPTGHKWRLQAFKKNKTAPTHDRLVTGFWKMCKLREKWENQESLHVLTWEANPSEVKAYPNWRK